MRLSLLISTLVAFAAAVAPVAAQEPPASPAPSETSAPTLMDREYDGHTSVLIAPYIWGASVKGNFQFSIPTLPRRPPKIVQPSVQVGPSDYVPKLNSAGMLAFDLRKGPVRSIRRWHLSQCIDERDGQLDDQRTARKDSKFRSGSTHRHTLRPRFGNWRRDSLSRTVTTRI